jgi:tetratricopeptide (TPR) repeat protein
LELGGNKRALIISISKYDDPGIQDLEFCEKDGELMYDALTKTGFEIPQENVLIGHVDSFLFNKTIREFFRGDHVKPDDTLLFYYSGHGVPKGKDEYYIVTSDTDVSKPDVDGFPFSFMTSLAENSSSTKKISILDCCYSGGAKMSKGNKGSQALVGKNIMDNQFIEEGQGSYLLASSLSSQQSFNSKKGDSSVFTHYLVQGLSGKDRDAVDKYGYVTPEKLGNYVWKKMKNFDQDQRPIRKVEGSGEIYLAYYKELGSETSQGNLGPQQIDDYVKRAIEKQLQEERESISQTYQSIQKPEKPSIDIFKNSSINLKDAEGLVNRGYELDKLGKFQEAIQMYDKALEINPLDMQALYNKGNSLYLLGRFPEALILYDKALEIDPLDGDTLNNKGNAQKQINDLRRNKGKFGKEKKLIKLYDKALGIDPTNVNALIKKGEIMYGKKKYLESISLFNKVLSSDPNNVVALNFKGNVIALIEKRESGLALFDQSIKVDPNNKWTFLCKGLAHMEFKQYDQAISSFDKALEIEPDYSEAKKARKTAIKKKTSKWPFSKIKK